MSDPSFDLDDLEPFEHYQTRLKLLSKIEFDKVDLPSGKVTVKQLRKLYPNEEGFLDESVNQDDSRLDLMETQEKTIVLLAYSSVLGKDAVNEVRTAFHVDKAELARAYLDNLIYYGQAEGLETAKQILRRIEETGAAIAREHLARSVPPSLR
jgi:hypothetical protein